MTCGGVARGLSSAGPAPEYAAIPFHRVSRRQLALSDTSFGLRGLMLSIASQARPDGTEIQRTAAAPVGGEGKAPPTRAGYRDGRRNGAHELIGWRRARTTSEPHTSYPLEAGVVDSRAALPMCLP